MRKGQGTFLGARLALALPKVRHLVLFAILARVLATRGAAALGAVLALEPIRLGGRLEFTGGAGIAARLFLVRDEARTAYCAHASGDAAVSARFAICAQRLPSGR